MVKTRPTTKSPPEMIKELSSTGSQVYQPNRREVVGTLETISHETKPPYLTFKDSDCSWLTITWEEQTTYTPRGDSTPSRTGNEKHTRVLEFPGKVDASKIGKRVKYSCRRNGLEHVYSLELV